MSTSRWQRAVGCHLLRSYLCPAQVGGGADLSPSAFSSGESLAGRGLIWHSPSQIITAQTVGCPPAVPPGLRVGPPRPPARPAPPWRLDAWRVSFHRQMMNVEWDQKGGFWAERWFSQWCAAEWLGFSARLCFCHLFLSLLQNS